MGPNAALVTLFSFAALGLAYVLYGRFLARRIFQLDPDRRTPAHELEDGVDYLPTKKPVLFGHHFASIAGLGPILGPAIAVIWGWVPAVIWVIVGCIFMGAVHDLGAITVSMRHKGRSIGDVCRDLIGPRARLLFLVIVFFLMSLAMGAFVKAITSLFVYFRPDAIIPSLGLMIVAMIMGVAVYRLKFSLGPTTGIALAAFGGLILWGVAQPVLTYEWFLPNNVETTLAGARAADAEAFASPYGAADAVAYFNSTGNEEAVAAVGSAAKQASSTWTWVLLGYGFLASVLPVWLLLQPRDYINSFQLYAALAMMVLGLTIATLTGAPESHIHAEAFRMGVVDDAPPVFPFLLVTIACGAISGFHSLVSSGTTVRQLDKETDALPIGFGAMLTEGGLAILIIMACVAGLGASAWAPDGIYSSWEGIGKASLGDKLDAVVTGGGAFLSKLGIPMAYGTAFLAVTITAFALTTLDSATRLLRFNVEEIFRSIGFGVLANRYIASACAVAGIAYFALSPAGADLWILFGTTNQLLAGLTLLAVSLFLFKLKRNMFVTLIPMVVMLSVSMWAMCLNVADSFMKEEWTRKEHSIIWVSLAVMAMSVWLIVEGILSFARGRDGGADPPATPPEVHSEEDEVAASAHLG
ncbi:Carbon starvation protein A [Planctomycetes bacterium Pan216]|uniref:Carbon starvation protein A n=1 Tax=Kolteria novifilia TaxID=2527975 RepID=A0A518BD35_9BACT|nr:Carbon starvation protein A [Planctomycetes bacterium Pan216]